MSRSVSPAWTATLLLGDLVATTVLAMGSVFLASMVAWQVDLVASGPRVYSFIAGQVVVGETLAGVLGLAAFFTSVWVWSYALSGAAVRLARSLGVGVTALRRVLDIDNKPITSLGWVAMLLASTLYWSLALVRWYAGT